MVMSSNGRERAFIFEMHHHHHNCNNKCFTRSTARHWWMDTAFEWFQRRLIGQRHPLTQGTMRTWKLTFTCHLHSIFQCHNTQIYWRQLTFENWWQKNAQSSMKIWNCSTMTIDVLDTWHKKAQAESNWVSSIFMWLVCALSKHGELAVWDGTRWKHWTIHWWQNNARSFLNNNFGAMEVVMTINVSGECTKEFLSMNQHTENIVCVALEVFQQFKGDVSRISWNRFHSLECCSQWNTCFQCRSHTMIKQWQMVEWISFGMWQEEETERWTDCGIESKINDLVEKEEVMIQTHALECLQMEHWQGIVNLCWSNNDWEREKGWWRTEMDGVGSCRKEEDIWVF